MWHLDEPAAHGLIAFLDGEFMPLGEARISPLDRGFVFADGVYEVIPAYGGRLLRLDAHLQRLENSLAGIRLANPLGRAAWREVLEGLVARNGGGDRSVYLQVTRGPAFPRDHAFPDHPQPTIFAMTTPLRGLDPALRAGGVRVISHADIRWDRCDLKTVALLPAVLMKQLAKEAGAFETLLVRHGFVMEGAASNVFAVRDGTLVTPPKGPFLLPGITRDLVLELAVEHAFPWREAELPLDSLAHVDELWLTSSTREIVPISALDGRPVADGRPGPVYARFYAWYQEKLAQLRAGTAQ